MRFGRRFRRHPKLPKAKLSEIAQDALEEGLPIKLPPKTKLGKVYKTNKTFQGSVLAAAMMLAIVTPLLATWVQNSSFNTQSSAYQSAFPQVDGFYVIDTNLQKRRQLLEPGDHHLNRPSLPAQLSFEAATQGKTKSVQFWVNGSEVRTDNTAPYTLVGETDGKVKAWNLPDEPFTLTAVAYSEPDGIGYGSRSISIDMTISPTDDVNLLPFDPTSVLGASDMTGDCNQDHVVDKHDLDAVNLEIFDGDGESVDQANQGTYPGLETCDVDGDQVVTQADMVCLQNLLLGKACTQVPEEFPLVESEL